MIRVLIIRVRKGTEAAIGEEQCGFRKGRGYVDQIFVVRQLCENFPRERRCTSHLQTWKGHMIGRAGVLYGKW